jgi:hypothetical protein
MTTGDLAGRPGSQSIQHRHMQLARSGVPRGPVSPSALDTLRGRAIGHRLWSGAMLSVFGRLSAAPDEVVPIACPKERRESSKQGCEEPFITAC